MESNDSNQWPSSVSLQEELQEYTIINVSTDQAENLLEEMRALRGTEDMTTEAVAAVLGSEGNEVPHSVDVSAITRALNERINIVRSLPKHGEKSLESVLTKGCSSVFVQKLQPNAKERLSRILEDEFGFTEFSYEGRGDEATVLSVPEAGVAIRLARVHEHDYKPKMPEVLQLLDEFVYEDTQNYADPFIPLKVQIMPLGTGYPSSRQARSLARSIECRGWYWKESKEENAILLPNGKTYVSDSASMYPVSGFGRPIWGEGWDELPKHYSEPFVGPTEPKPITLPVIRQIGTFIQRAVFAMRQAAVFRPPWQRWSFEEQLCGVPEKYHPGGDLQKSALEKRHAREIKEKVILEEFEKHRRIDREVERKLQEVFSRREGSTSSWEYHGEYYNDAAASVRITIQETGQEQWFLMDKEERFQNALPKMEAKRLSRGKK